jgi:heme/copper-type cytochrome/quinol oxidase subunit 4
MLTSPHENLSHIGVFSYIQVVFFITSFLYLEKDAGLSGTWQALPIAMTLMAIR